MEITITSLEKAPQDSIVISRFIEALNDHQLKYYAQDWMKSIGYTSMAELQQAISPLIDAMNSVHVSTSENIKPVYRCSNGHIFRDWKLSRLGLTYLALNSPHKNQKISQLQLKILMDYFRSQKDDPS